MFLQLLLVTALLGCGQAEEYRRNLLQKKERNPFLLQGLGGQGKLCQQTRNNCRCKESWGVRWDSERQSGCGNPRKETKFPWCMIEQGSCDQPRGIIEGEFFDICIPQCSQSTPLPNETVMGCECLEDWTYQDKQYKFCYNPDNDMLGQWCVVNETTCKDKNMDNLGIIDIGLKQVKWDYCYYGLPPQFRSTGVKSKGGEMCFDKQPDSVTLNCGWVQENQQCGNIDEQYCKQSCGRCKDCTDAEQEVALNCTQILDLELCSEIGVEYCKNTCGRCYIEADIIETDFLRSVLLVDWPELPDSRGPQDGDLSRILSPGPSPAVTSQDILPPSFSPSLSPPTPFPPPSPSPVFVAIPVPISPSSSPSLPPSPTPPQPSSPQSFIPSPPVLSSNVSYDSYTGLVLTPYEVPATSPQASPFPLLPPQDVVITTRPAPISGYDYQGSSYTISQDSTNPGQDSPSLVPIAVPTMVQNNNQVQQDITDAQKSPAVQDIPATQAGCANLNDTLEANSLLIFNDFMLETELYVDEIEGKSGYTFFGLTDDAISGFANEQNIDVGDFFLFKSNVAALRQILKLHITPNSLAPDDLADANARSIRTLLDNEDIIINAQSTQVTVATSNSPSITSNVVNVASPFEACEGLVYTIDQVLKPIIFTA